MAFAFQQNVEVRVRIRPGESNSLRVHQDQTMVSCKDKCYAFDGVFGPEVSQEEVYVESVQPLVEACLEGYNATVLAYGQTGSGKTFTMGCGAETLGGAAAGCVPRCMLELFEAASESALCVRGSYVEIYNEELRDLLSPGTSKDKLLIRENASRGVFVSGAVERPLSSVEEAIGLLALGAERRTTAGTHMNDQSSRSHAILTLVGDRATHG